MSSMLKLGSFEISVCCLDANFVVFRFCEIAVVGFIMTQMLVGIIVVRMVITTSMRMVNMLSWNMKRLV